MSEMTERVARAIENALIEYSIRLTKLIGDDCEYTLRFGNRPVETFPSYKDASDRVRQLQRDASARAAIEAVAEGGNLIDRTKLSPELTYLWTLQSRLAARSRTELFGPGSVAPELLRRCEEAINELQTALRDASFTGTSQDDDSAGGGNG